MKQKIDRDTLMDVPRLQAWLDANTPELGTGPPKAEVIHGGTS